jgi:DNA-directed RNA polymerase specialized sigma24 family protein
VSSTVEEQFTAIYREQYKRVVTWVYWKLPKERTHQAEDYAQEAFHDLWEHLLKGRTVDYPFALLKKIAQRRMADYYQSRKANAATDAVDFDEPSTAVVEAVSGHRYAAGDPELSLLAGALWEAVEVMREASEKWRALHALTGRMRPLGEPYPTYPRQATRGLKMGAARDQAHRERDEALVEFQAACAEVGVLRAELERLGGQDWKSSTGWPPPACGGGGVRSRKTAICDPDVTECPQGHSLSLDTCGFLADGTRTCRACYAETTRRYRSKKEATV